MYTGVNITGKTISGEIPILNCIVFQDYIIFYRTLIHTYRIFKPQPITTKIKKGQYISGWLNDIKHLYNAGSNCSKILQIDTTSELPRCIYNPNIIYICVALYDCTSPTNEQFNYLTNLCNQYYNNNYDIVIQCAYGHGRSATLTIAYLLSQKLDSDIFAIEKSLYTIRRGVKLNRLQLKALVNWLHKKN